MESSERVLHQFLGSFYLTSYANTVHLCLLKQSFCCKGKDNCISDLINDMNKLLNMFKYALFVR